MKTLKKQICELLKQRKEISSNNQGYPKFEYIEKWAIPFDLYEDYLKSVFHVLRNEEHYKPIVEPLGFRKNVPILKFKEQEEFFYTVTSMRQYSNASVITFNIDWDVMSDQSLKLNKTKHFELYLGETYIVEWIVVEVVQCIYHLTTSYRQHYLMIFQAWILSLMSSILHKINRLGMKSSFVSGDFELR